MHNFYKENFENNNIRFFSSQIIIFIDGVIRMTCNRATVIRKLTDPDIEIADLKMTHITQSDIFRISAYYTCNSA